jgi:uncharacterized protein (DUF362 family)/NAD-dependent dihydropyrimidine dehydrogenase PreA subunit
MKTVSLQALPDYDPATVAASIDALLSPLGGIQTFISPGQKVLIKPNMLAGKAPEKAVTTHPSIVREVIRRVQSAGAVAVVGDSPGIGSCRQVAQKCGILQVIEETGAKLARFTESVPIGGSGESGHRLEVAQEVISADVIVNLPKLKTHQMVGMTGAVKNMFGAVVGMRKPHLHLQAGSDKARFACMLLDLCEKIMPALTIVDAGLAMEGNGPGSGNPVWIGALLAGDDPVAVDAAALELLGLPPHRCWTQQVALERELRGSSLAHIRLVGTPVTDLRPPRFLPAKSTDVNFGLPSLFKKRLRRSLSAFPKIDPHLCSNCGQCVKHCPPQAMTLDLKRVRIDLDNCISCFCCQELCPEGAIETQQGLLLRLADFISSRT